jgi:hypothetical protein
VLLCCSCRALLLVLQLLLPACPLKGVCVDALCTPVRQVGRLQPLNLQQDVRTVKSTQPRVYVHRNRPTHTSHWVLIAMPDKQFRAL